MMRVLALATLLACAFGAYAEVPLVSSFRVVPQFPDPAVGAGLVMGTAVDGNGRLVLWDGDTVYLQELIGNQVGPLLEPIATGFAGDPAFVDLKSNGRTVVMGSGPDGTLLQLQDVLNPQDFQPANAIPTVTHFSGVLLNDNLVALDRMKDDLSGAEIVVVDLLAAANAGRGTAPVMATVLEKPANSLPATLTIDPGANALLVMNANTRVLRRFDRGAVINAFLNGETLDWTQDGAPVGTAGTFLNGGVYGVTPDRQYVIGGDEGTAGTGGIQYVNATTGNVIATLDPAGSGPPFVLIYNRFLDETVATDPTVTPPDAYASEDAIPAIPPESPCRVFDEVDMELQTFLEQFSADSADLDQDGIPETAMFELIELFSCRNNESDAITFATNTAYDTNLEVFAQEASFAQLEAFQRAIPVLMFMSSAMQDAVRALMSDNGTPLNGSYDRVFCTGLAQCFPEFVEDPDPDLRAPRGVFEPYTASGDPDGDGLTNLEEYTNVVAIGGDGFDFGVAAASDALDGSSGISGNGGGGCFIATAAYGSPLAAELDALRRLRDTGLLRHAGGSAFVDSYYRLSPPLAAWIAGRPHARAAARTLLTPLLFAAKNPAAGLAIALIVFSLLALQRIHARVGRSNE